MAFASVNPATGGVVATFEAHTDKEVEERLQRAAETFASGVISGPALSRAAAQVIESEPGARLDYTAVVDPVDFRPVEVANAESRVMVAAKIEAVRLIDTALLGSPPRLGG